MIVLLSLFFYLILTWSILRFFQVLFKLDERMRIITNEYIEARGHSPL